MPYFFTKYFNDITWACSRPVCVLVGRTGKRHKTRYKSERPFFADLRNLQVFWRIKKNRALYTLRKRRQFS